MRSITHCPACGDPILDLFTGESLGRVLFGEVVYYCGRACASMPVTGELAWT